MRFFRRSLIATVATALCLAPSTPVAAAPASCAFGYACIYWNSGFGGLQYSRNVSTTSLGSMGDQGSSLGNSRNYLTRFYQHASYGGWNVCVSMQNSSSSLPGDRNDEISSQYQGSPYTAYC